METRRTASEGHVASFLSEVVDNWPIVAILGLGPILATATLTSMHIGVDPLWGVAIVAGVIAIPSIGDLGTRLAPSFFYADGVAPRNASTLPFAAIFYVCGAWLEWSDLVVALLHTAVHLHASAEWAVHLIGAIAIVVAGWTARVLYTRLAVDRMHPRATWGRLLERHVALGTVACFSAIIAAHYLHLVQVW